MIGLSLGISQIFPWGGDNCAWNDAGTAGVGA